MEADTAGGKTLLEVRVQPGGEVQRCEPAHQIRSPQRCVWGCLQKPQRLGQLHRFIPNPFPILISMIDPLARRVIPLSKYLKGSALETERNARVDFDLW
jgi:hypothetical protein